MFTYIHTYLHIITVKKNEEKHFLQINLYTFKKKRKKY